MVVIFGFIFLFQPAWQEYRVQAAVERGDLHAGDRVTDLIDGARTDSRKLHLIEQFMLEHSVCCSPYDVFITPNMSSYGEERYWSGFTLTEMKPYLEFYEERSIQRNTWLVEEAIIGLADYYANYDSVEKAIDFLNQKREEYMEHSTLIHPPEQMTIKLAQLYVEHRQFDGAINVIEEYEDAIQGANDEQVISYVNEEFLEIRIEILLLQQKKNEALQLLEKWQEQTQTAENYDDYTASERVTSLKRQLELIEGDFAYGTVEGNLRREDGTPIVGAEIFLRQNHRANTSIHPESERYRATTDQEGYYKFSRVMPNEYQVGIGFTYEQIDGYSWPVDMEDRVVVQSREDIVHDIVLLPLLDVYFPVNEYAFTERELTFSWEEDPKATTYDISMINHTENGWTSQVVKSGIKDTTTMIDVRDLYHNPFNVSFDNDVYDEDWFDPRSMLGFANTESQFSWAITSYDQNGNELRRSFGYRLDDELVSQFPFFQLKQRKLTKADQLLLDGKVDQALESYEQDLLTEEGLEQEHALIMAVKVLQYVKSSRGDDDKELRMRMKDHIKELYERTEIDYYAELLDEAENKL